MKFAGIDYSLTSPCVCTYDTDRGDFCFNKCAFTAITDKKVKGNIPHNIFIQPHTTWSTSDQRYHDLAVRLISMGGFRNVDRILIEDYSMGSKGKVFHIAENTEVLQYNLFLMKKKYEKIPPTSLKKWATGKGNADKEKMYERFLEIEGIDLKAMLGLTKADSPLSDIVDAYFLTKYIYENS